MQLNYGCPAEKLRSCLGPIWRYGRNELDFTWKGQGRNYETHLSMLVLGAGHYLTFSSAEALVGWRAEQLDIDEGVV